MNVLTSIRPPDPSASGPCRPPVLECQRLARHVAAVRACEQAVKSRRPASRRFTSLRRCESGCDPWQDDHGIVVADRVALNRMAIVLRDRRSGWPRRTGRRSTQNRHDPQHRVDPPDLPDEVDPRKQLTGGMRSEVRDSLRY
jgi:hypothetical protein